jgi:hypothetical protein
MPRAASICGTRRVAVAKKVMVELPDDVYEALQKLAKDSKESPADTLAKSILTRKVLKEKSKVLVEDEDGKLSELTLK